MCPGTVLYRAGDADRAVAVLERARRLSPRQPASLLWGLAYAQLIAGRFDDAIATTNQAVAPASGSEIPHVLLTAAHGALGRREEATAAAARLLEVDPGFTVAGWKAGQPDFKDPTVVDQIASYLRAAGLPE